MFQIPSLALRIHQHSRVGETVGQHTLPMQPTAPCSTCSQKKKTHLLTLLLQNHLDHFNILLQDLWHINDLLSRVDTTVNMYTSTRAVACSKVAKELTSDNLHDFFHETQHWHIHDLLLDLRLGKQDPLLVACLQLQRLARNEA